MTEVKVRFYSLLKDVTKLEKISLSIEKSLTIKDILERLIEKFGKDFEELVYQKKGELNKYLLVVLNEKDIRSVNGLATNVQDGDKITFIPAIAGG
jgi:MoaD family protein